MIPPADCLANSPSQSKPGNQTDSHPREPYIGCNRTDRMHMAFTIGKDVSKQPWATFPMKCITDLGIASPSRSPLVRIRIARTMEAAWPHKSEVNET